MQNTSSKSRLSGRKRVMRSKVPVYLNSGDILLSQLPSWRRQDGNGQLSLTRPHLLPPHSESKSNLSGYYWTNTHPALDVWKETFGMLSAIACSFPGSSLVSKGTYLLNKYFNLLKCNYSPFTQWKGTFLALNNKPKVFHMQDFNSMWSASAILLLITSLNQNNERGSAVTLFSILFIARFTIFFLGTLNFHEYQIISVFFFNHLFVTNSESCN